MELNHEYSDALFRANVGVLANYLFIARGSLPGHEAEYWLEAEAQLKQCLASDPEASESRGRASFELGHFSTPLPALSDVRARAAKVRAEGLVGPHE